VLIVGRSRPVLDEAVALLEQRGHRARATNDFDAVLGEADPAELDLVVLGGQVPPAKQDEIRAEMLARNPDLDFVQGLSGIAGLIADQVEEALAGEVLIPVQAPIYDASERVIAMSLYATLDVTATAYWVAQLMPSGPVSGSAVLFAGSLPAGDHRFPVPDDLPLDAAFATVRAGEASWSFQLAGVATSILPRVNAEGASAQSASPRRRSSP
jgi:ABC-type sugar transport system substrate-binding protein